MGNTVVITSGKGGVGKTTVTASLGLALASRGVNTLLIDGDVGLNNLDVALGMENRAAYDMADVMAGKCRVSQAILQVPGYPLYIMPSAHAVYSEQIKAGDFRTLTGRLGGSFDYILIDCPAGIEGGFHRAVSASEYAIVVTTPHISAVRDADKVVTLLSGYNLRGVSLIVNRVRGDLLARGETLEPREISRLLRYPLLGVIPEDDGVAVCAQLGRPDMNESCSRAAFDMVAANMLTGEGGIYDPTLRYRGILGAIRSRLKKNA